MERLLEVGSGEVIRLAAGARWGAGDSASARISCRDHRLLHNLSRVARAGRVRVLKPVPRQEPSRIQMRSPLETPSPCAAFPGFARTTASQPRGSTINPH